MYVVVLACYAAMTGVVARAEEDKTVSSTVRPIVDEERLNVEALQVLDARGGFIRLEGRSLFLTSDVKKDAQAGYWFNIGPTPRRPSLVCGSLPGGWDVAVAGEYAFVCDYTKFLTVYEIRDHHWQQTARLQMPSMTENIIILNQGEMAVDGDFAYCTAVNGLVIVNIADQDNPKLAKAVDLKGRVSDVIVKDGYAFLAAGPKGVLVLDVSDPAAPAQVGFYKASKGFAASQIAIQRAVRAHDAAINRTESSEKAAARGASASGHAASGSDTDYLIYVANSKGPAMVLLFRAPLQSGRR